MTTPVDIDKLKPCPLCCGKQVVPDLDLRGFHETAPCPCCQDGTWAYRAMRTWFDRYHALIAKAERVDAMEAALTEAAATFDQFAAALREHEPVAMAQEIATAELAASEARNTLSPKESE